ncbi:hypothetical protein [Alterinioella nitratireducens]|uniref:hypothetical protein n=1 Tax=Alterinioella nitratireducens TaxID=2735915 RepID=UPI0015533459|nr:hypothetical protein [Alterinioella nitratireducens]NPD21733.1 hypothetical protein [Alterinioella nitratireducens]
MIQEDGTANGADFRLRPNRPDETGVSVNWLEAFDTDKAQQLAEVRRLYRLTVRRTGRFAELNIGAVREKVTEELATLRIVHDPLEADGDFEADHSHAEIDGLPPGDSPEADMIGDMIAECVINMHPAIEEP